MPARNDDDANDDLTYREKVKKHKQQVCLAVAHCPDDDDDGPEYRTTLPVRAESHG